MFIVMLAENLIEMKIQLNRLSSIIEQDPELEQNPKSPFWEAAKIAYYETIKADIQDVEDTDFKDKIAEARIKAEKEANKAANKFAYYFCKVLNDNKVWNTIADEIDGHVKSIEPVINLISPTHGSLVCPSGPVTGAMVGTIQNGGIQIM